MKKQIGLLAGVAVAVDYALLAYTGNMAVLNPATFTMWALLDAVIFVGMVRAGNREAYLIGSYGVGAALIAVLSFIEGQWHWGALESFCAAGVAIALILLYRAEHNEAGVRKAILVSVSCMVISSLPSIYQYALMPSSDGWWFWAIAAVCSAITLRVARGWTVEDRLFPLASTLVSAAITAIVLIF